MRDEKLLISFDYDNTYTADPKGMRALIRCMQSNGYEVVMVTLRSREHDWDGEFTFLKDEYGLEVYFTDGQAKRKFMEDRGVYIDIWFDDMPEGITSGSTYSPEELQVWRENNKLKVV